MESTNFLNELVAKGYELYPVKNKIPLTKHGFKDATNNTKIIRSWKQSYKGCQWALRLDTSDLMVLDVDNHDDDLKGSRALASFTKEEQSFFASCPVDITPNNGIHIFMKKPKNINVEDVNLGNGLEIKTKNICLYEQFTNSVVNAPVAQQFILKLKKPKGSQPIHSSHAYSTGKKYTGALLDRLVAATDSGSRNNHLTSLAGSMFAVGADPDTVEQLLYLVNDNFITPSLPEKEVQNIYNSILKSEATKGA